ncbi:MAG: MGMT family protein [Synergistaceae bacterium]|nr:MGMT family protein [Synergistaceae bacterium]
MNFYDKVYAIVARIPKGKVASYGQVASWAGSWRASRAVGYALFHPPLDLPCHRVVYRDGSLTAESVFGPGVQRRLLEKEGVRFTSDGRVNMKESAWDGEPQAPSSSGLYNRAQKRETKRRI